jgi:Cd2+/Zn2+-exporting ATPase
VLESLAADAASRGESIAVVGKDDHACGVIALTDAPRATAREAVSRLESIGVARITLLTGDNHASAAAMASLVGISEIHAGLLPEDKIDFVERLRRETGGPVALVGDGINDAPALASADLGIAMGDGGTDVAVETADVALLADDLTRIPWLVRHSRRVVRLIRANIIFALSVKAAFVALTALGAASLWAAIAADMGASLAVIANSLRLLRD